MDRPRFRAVFFHPRFWLLWLGLGLLWLITQLPYRALLGIGRVLGAFMYRVAGERRRIAARNLELCFPQMSAQERKHFAQGKLCLHRHRLFRDGHELVVVQTASGAPGPC
ncbi:hypothetical protein [Staphylococcus hominis]|uniref:LpxL/LpxP family acyltransferase n=1 Tax=Staphylococcus hominis TaxID=1290 RepID=UPI0018E1EBB3